MLYIMEIQLKKVYFSEQLSEETNAFTADVYFKGKRIGYAKNDGHGGCTDVRTYGRETIKQFNEAEEYAKSLPQIEHEFNGKVHKWDSNLEAVVDDLFTEWLNKKEIQKEQRKGIFYQKPNGTKATIYWKGYTIATLKKHPQGIGMIKAKVLELQNDGHTILNTNLGSILS